jgi:hypothetical protein
MWSKFARIDLPLALKVDVSFYWMDQFGDTADKVFQGGHSALFIVAFAALITPAFHNSNYPILFRDPADPSRETSLEESGNRKKGGYGACRNPSGSLGGHPGFEPATSS